MQDAKSCEACAGVHLSWRRSTGYTYFIPQEEHLESRVVTRSYMEAKMVVALAGRCAEKLILGDASIGRGPRSAGHQAGHQSSTGDVALLQLLEAHGARRAHEHHGAPCRVVSG